MPSKSKKGFFMLSMVYGILLHVFVMINAANEKDSQGVAIMGMGLTLVTVWILIGGYLQRRYLFSHYERLTQVRSSPVFTFAIMAIFLACIEELIAVIITNLAPLYGVTVGEAYITASTNYFDVITMHSVIVFAPMLFTLGVILRKYAIPPFRALIIFGLVGVCAEFSFAGPQAILAFPTWLFIYGLMVYVPAHIFVNTERKKPFFLLYPLFIIAILASAITTVWIPIVSHHPKIDFISETATN